MVCTLSYPEEGELTCSSIAGFIIRSRDRLFSDFSWFSRLRASPLGEALRRLPPGTRGSLIDEADRLPQTIYPRVQERISGEQAPAIGEEEEDGS